MDNSLIIYIVATVLAVLGIVFVTRKEKKVAGIGKGVWSILIVLGALMFLWQYGLLFQWFPGQEWLQPMNGVNQYVPFTQVQGGSGVTQVVAGGACLAVEKTTVTLSGQDKYLATASGGSHTVRVNDGISQSVTDASTLTASPGDTLEILWGAGDTDDEFSSVDTYTVPCKGTYPITKQLVNNGTMTVTLFTDPNNVAIDGSTTNQTLSAGDQKNVRMIVQGQYQKDIPYGAILVVEFNKTSMDDVIVSAGGVELPSSSVPQTYSATYGAESTKKAYVFPALISNAQAEYTIALDADDSTSATSAGSDVLLYWYDRNYFVNDNNGGAFEGPSAEDEDNTITRASAHTSTLHIE